MDKGREREREREREAGERTCSAGEVACWMRLNASTDQICFDSFYDFWLKKRRFAKISSDESAAQPSESMRKADTNKCKSALKSQSRLVTCFPVNTFNNRQSVQTSQLNGSPDKSERVANGEGSEGGDGLSSKNKADGMGRQRATSHRVGMFRSTCVCSNTCKTRANKVEQRMSQTVCVGMSTVCFDIWLRVQINQSVRQSMRTSLLEGNTHTHNSLSGFHSSFHLEESD
jgi:hypothetical protein